jgi:hypothetical protein
MQDADRVTHTKMLQERARAEAAEAERDRLAAELAEANAKITQMTVGWGEDAVRIEELQAELAEARRFIDRVAGVEWQADEPASGWCHGDDAEAYVAELEHHCNWTVKEARDLLAPAKGDTDDRA